MKTEQTAIEITQVNIMQKLESKYKNRQPKRFVVGYTDLCCKCERKASWYDGHYLLKSRDAVGAGFCNLHRIKDEAKLIIGVYDDGFGLVSNKSKARRIKRIIDIIVKSQINIIEP